MLSILGLLSLSLAMILQPVLGATNGFCPARTNPAAVRALCCCPADEACTQAPCCCDRPAPSQHPSPLPDSKKDTVDRAVPALVALILFSAPEPPIRPSVSALTGLLPHRSAPSVHSLLCVWLT
jgi:hypothetical protein